MGRWEPNARERLSEAALELYAERGYEQTTVAEIAAQAGLTERTFFRYFADKREVLFWGADNLRDVIVEVVAAAPASFAPLDVVAAAVEAAATAVQDMNGHAFARKRQRVIMSHAELKERELIKLASLATSIAEALHKRGTKDPVASLAAEAGIAAFKVGFQRWVEESKPRDISRYVRSAIDELKKLATSAPAKKR